MEFLFLCNIFETLEKTSSRLEKTDIVSSAISACEKEEIADVVYLILGRTHPAWSTEKIGVKDKLLIRAVSDISGVSESELLPLLVDTGDIGRTVEEAIKRKRQVFFGGESLSIQRVTGDLRKVASLEGKRSQEKKLKIISGLFTNASALEARYLARIVVEAMRTGVAEGIVRDAIAKSFSLCSADVERAYMMANDMGLVAEHAYDGTGALEAITLELFRPVKMMAAKKVSSAEEGFDVVGRPCALEYKYDGFRMQIHKKGDRIEIFTRRLENVTAQFVDVVKRVRKCIDADCIIEGETIGIGPNGRWLPFQSISRRIKRKYDIEEIIDKIPVMTNIFDILYYGDSPVIDRPFEERRRLLESVVSPSDGEFVLSKMVVTDSIEAAQLFFDESIDRGNEGLMLKNISSPYVPGLRVGNMVKLKSVLESLDCIVVGAEWGTGRRARVMGTFVIAILDEEGKAQQIGKVATGITDEMLEELTERLRPLIISESGTTLEIRPEIVVEVAYEEIQMSPTYESGFALRFPRLVRLRDDKGAEDADTIERVYDIYSADSM